MNTITKTARKSATALLFGMIALTGITAQAMDDAEVETILRHAESGALSKFIGILDRCLQAEKAKGTHSGKANRGLQSCVAMAEGRNHPLDFSVAESRDLYFYGGVQVAERCVRTLNEARESGKYKDRALAMYIAMDDCQKMITVSKGLLDILEKPEDKK